eukprot:CAMPEP_0117682022 /NCGR_PEP_ID=MMETSP0804-20121206/19369_1 /TAXON_ID=1074897 /ORGANISM="Tetraselmis astigmatica, Strain CCMP880" /LENGTH=626 /DNA_ID=CAMNT_0005491969 /DNA_START=9 /DNA_END=1889 /DNA_ORIENTATION=-
MSFVRTLPTPQHDYSALRSSASAAGTPQATAVTRREPPPYGARKGFVPKKVEDFGDGGAFPEILIPQFPMNMGRPEDSGRGNKTLALTMDASGETNYSAVVKQGQNAKKYVHSSHSDIVPKPELMRGDNVRPDEEEVEATRKETLEALQKVVNSKIQAANPKTLPKQPGAATYINYTPSQQGEQYNSGAKQRIIKMQDMPIDPMEPPKFRHKKVPRAGGSPPVPIMHSPPRAVTVKDQQDWKIPPCISNWKNPKGYTIPLDKRLAADGRGLQEVQINDNFAKLSESLYIAEQKAREAVEMRSKIQREILAKEKEKKEAELRELAQRARLERAGVAPGGPAAGGLASRVDAEPAAAAHGSPRSGSGSDMEHDAPPRDMGRLRDMERRHDHRHRDDDDDGHRRDRYDGRVDDDNARPRHRESREEREERKKRDEIREERRRERERERRLEAKDAKGFKRSKLTRDRDRDISEKMALGQANVGKGGGETMYDARLFNQEGGTASGLAADDQYNLYDKPLFADRGSSLYKAGRRDRDADEDGEDVDTGRFKPDKGFKGADVSAGPRSKPVEFERQEEDPFGLGVLMDDVRGRKKGALDGIGSRGGMSAGGGGGGDGSSRRRMEFQSSDRR